MRRGFVVWLTGLPGSGKTTIARRLEPMLRSLGLPVEVLDGDEVRKWLSPEAGFSREDRERHLRRVAHVSHLLARNGVAVIASFVSPYRSVRDFARELIKDFVEVYVKCSLETCMRRDPKGLYKRALKGEISDMTGLQDVYEEPLKPEVVVDTEQMSPEECAQRILETLKKLGYIQSHRGGVIMGSEEKVSVAISRSLYDRISEKVRESEGAFKSVEEFIEFVLTEVLREEEGEEYPYTPEEEEEIKRRLRALGYL